MTVNTAANYKAVIFDNDGVLVESPNKETFHRAVEQTFHNLAHTQPNHKDVRAFLSRNVKALRKMTDRHQFNLDEFCREVASQILREQKREFKQGIRDLYDDVVSLRSLNLSLGVVSDNQYMLVEYALRYLGIEDWFDTIYGVQFTPEGLHRMKPSPYYLNKALRDLETREALYIGDSACDIEAATNAGIDSVLLCRSGDSIDCGVTPTYVVSSLRAVPEFLE